MKIIEIKEDKYDDLCENIENGLRFLGKAMQCLDDMKGEGMEGEEESEYGMRGYGMRDGGYGERDGEYGMRGGYGRRDGASYGMRRGVKGTGRYSRY